VRGPEDADDDEDDDGPPRGRGLHRRPSREARAAARALRRLARCHSQPPD
jgi:hypothetical protein